MAEQTIDQYYALKQELTDFVFDAEDAIAIALESFSAQQLSRWSQPVLSGLDRNALAVDMFLTEGKVSDASVIDLFLKQEPTYADIKRWQKAFNGLFVVRDVSAEGYSLMNWLTEKNYAVQADSSRPVEMMSRFSPGEIVLGRLLPITADDWIFSGPLTLLGKLGKPKLAVAIGNFKKWFPRHLYGDAPELKEAAWESVQQQYDDFLTFFGTPPITLSGYELNKKVQAYQEQTTEKQLEKAGLDSSKSLQEMAKDAGVSEDEISAALSEAGEESAVAKRLLESKRSLKMVMPKVSLPDDLRRAEKVTVFSHPRWGQTFLKDYSRFVELLGDEGGDVESLDRQVQKYLEDEQVNAYVWHQMAAQYGSALQPSLRRVLGKPEFEIASDLDGAIAQYDKPLTPELPDSASVPLHLHNLFQEAMQMVGKGDKAKASKGSKKKGKKKSGFGA